MKTERGYQTNFSSSHPRICDAHHRGKKARKIELLLTAHFDHPLTDLDCLDIGCSAGIMTIQLAPLFRTISGIEFDLNALRSHPDLPAPQVRFVGGDAMNLPFPDACFDFVLCAQVYEHVPNDERLAEEIHRILKPGGYIFFSGPNKLYPVELHYSLPFVHWLPQSLADKYLQLFKKGVHYYEKSRTLWGLKKLFVKFEIHDLTVNAIQLALLEKKGWLWSALARLPASFWKIFVPLVPNFNWVLHKPEPQ